MIILFFISHYNMRIFLHGFLTHEAIMQIYTESDFLLNIGNTNTAMLPSKLFEYMSTGKPIICTYTSKYDTSNEYIIKYPNSILLNENKPIDQHIKPLEKFLNKDFKILDLVLYPRYFMIFKR